MLQDASCAPPIARRWSAWVRFAPVSFGRLGGCFGPALFGGNLGHQVFDLAAQRRFNARHQEIARPLGRGDGVGPRAQLTEIRGACLAVQPHRALKRGASAPCRLTALVDAVHLEPSPAGRAEPAGQENRCRQGPSEAPGSALGRGPGEGSFRRALSLEGSADSAA